LTSWNACGKELGLRIERLAEYLRVGFIVIPEKDPARRLETKWKDLKLKAKL
jgi:hypothetical protein